ncbi:MAG: hypothetical protein NT150_09775 [Bacteroidetes bacterium]|nr:hypothetical protein [Bacteroidota bacterium]
MMFRISKVVSIFSIFVAITLLGGSCYKPTDCNGVINCVDLSTGDPVAGATVKLFVTNGDGFYLCDGSQTKETILTADASGSVKFCLKYAATPSVLVTAGAKTGTGVIATAPGKDVVSVTIKVK